MLRYLHSKGVDLNAPNSSGHTSLHKAAWRGHTDALHYLIFDLNGPRLPPPPSLLRTLSDYHITTHEFTPEMDLAIAGWVKQYREERHERKKGRVAIQKHSNNRDEGDSSL